MPEAIQEKPVPFAPLPPKLSETQQKEVDAEIAHEKYRAAVSAETGRPTLSFSQLDDASKEEFMKTGKLSEVEAGPVPREIHVVRNAAGVLVLVTHHKHPIYVTADEKAGLVLSDVNYSAILAKTGATPFGNFTIVDGAWAYKGRTLFTTAAAGPSAAPWQVARVDGEIEKPAKPKTDAPAPVQGPAPQPESQKK